MQRFISQHRWQQFAQLYDPEAIESPADQDEDSPVTLSLQLTGKRYKRYRLLLLERNPHCFYCGAEVTEASCSLDHVIPKTRGGTSGPGNLELSCRKCNGEKTDSTPMEWLERIQSEIDQLTQKANQLAEVIEAHDLEQFQADRERRTAIHHESQPRRKAGDPANDLINANHLKPGKASYTVRNPSTGEVLARGMKFREAVGYFKEAATTDVVLLESVRQLSGKLLDRVTLSQHLIDCVEADGLT